MPSELVTPVPDTEAARVADLLRRVRLKFEEVLDEQKAQALAVFDEKVPPSVHTLVSCYGVGLPVVVQTIGTPDSVWVTSNVDEHELTLKQLERAASRVKRTIEADDDG